MVGFCYGGAIANYLATVLPGLAAAVPFYGSQPPAGAVANIRAPLMIHDAGKDARILAGWPAYEAALKANKVDAAIEGRATVIQEAEGEDGLEALDEPPLKPSLISMGVLPGDQVWINYLNNFIRNLNASGTNAELYQEWFGEDLPDVVR